MSQRVLYVFEFLSNNSEGHAEARFPSFSPSHDGRNLQLICHVICHSMTLGAGDRQGG